MLARFRDRWAASGMSIASVVSEWGASCTSCLRQTGDSTPLTPCPSVVIQPHREDMDLSASLLLHPWVTPAVSPSPDLVWLTEDPLSACSPHSLASTSALTRDPSSLPFEIVTPGFNKGSPSLAVDGKHVLCLCARVLG